MARYYADRVAFGTATTGTGNITPGAEINDSFRAPGETSITNGDNPILLIQEGTDYEICESTWNGSVFSRDTVITSKIGGTAGTSKMNLAGAATVRFVMPSLLWSEIQSGFQPLDADLTSWAAISRASGFDTFVATPSSANFASLVTGETGSGALVFGTSPGFTTAANPISNDGATLGETSTPLRWSDIFLADGGVVNIGTTSSKATLTHVAASDSLIIAADPDNATASSVVGIETDGTRRVTIDSDGLKFFADTAAANALDDYEEGTWTPVISMTGTNFTSVTYDANRSGKYTKIGRMVYIQGVLKTDAVTIGSASGSVIFTGLPFTVASGIEADYGQIKMGYCANWAVNNATQGLIEPATTRILMYYGSNTDNSTQLAAADVGTGTNDNDTYFSGFYAVP